MYVNVGLSILVIMRDYCDLLAEAFVVVYCKVIFPSSLLIIFSK